MRVCRMQKYFLCLFTSLTLIICTPLEAKIYKYQDDNGKWHFSDKPITQKQKRTSQTEKNNAPVKIIYQDPDSPYSHQNNAKNSNATKKAGSIKTPKHAEKNDLAAKLEKRFKPQSLIEKVTLAVVSVETAISVGSGFFISNDGYLLTNKHVIRPGEGKKFEEKRDEFAEIQQQLQDKKDWLDNEKIRLKNYKIELDEYAKSIRQASSGSRKTTAAADYEILLDRYNGMQKQYDDISSQYSTAKKRLDKQESQFRLKSSAAQLERRFKIILKDNTELRADLIAISQEYDLALLKLDGYKTPMIEQQTTIPSQGNSVYAIGSPLGIRDTVTSGIITRSDTKAIMTDAQILPGNSGGPLVTSAGEVVGVNTQKVFHQTVQGEGFGIAIPLIKAYETFAGKIPKPSLD